MRVRVLEFGKTRGRSKHPREDSRLSSHWGKEPESKRKDARTERKYEKHEGEEVGLYIIAHCIIYKETRNNSGGCLSAMCWRAILPQRLKEMPQCTHTHTLQQPTDAVIYRQAQSMLTCHAHVLRSHAQICYCVHFLVHSGAEGKPLYLPLTPWCWREISVLQLCRHLFLAYPQTAYHYSIMTSIHIFVSTSCGRSFCCCCSAPFLSKIL